MSEITKGELRAFTADWKARNRSVRTVSDYVRVLNHYIEIYGEGGYTLADVRGFVESEQARAQSAGRWAARAFKAFDAWQSYEYEEPLRLAKLRVPKDPIPQKIGVASPEDVTKVLKACEGPDFCDLRDAAIVHVFRSTGMRIGELQRMEMKHIDTETGHCVIPYTKNGERRVVKLDEPALKALRKYRRGMSVTDYPYVWESYLGGQMRPHSIQKRITARATAAGVPHVTPHSFRRGWSQRAHRAKMPLEYMMALGGWNTPEMPGRYIKAVRVEDALAFEMPAFG